MVVERFGSNDLREIKDPPADYPDCIYCYAASKTCVFYREGDTHIIRVEGELRAVTCERKIAGMTAVSCAPVTEEEAKKLITTLGYAYN